MSGSHFGTGTISPDVAHWLWRLVGAFVAIYVLKQIVSCFLAPPQSRARPGDISPRTQRRIETARAVAEANARSTSAAASSTSSNPPAPSSVPSSSLPPPSLLSTSSAAVASSSSSSSPSLTLSSSGSMPALRDDFSATTAEREAKLRARKQALLEQARHRFVEKAADSAAGH